MRRRPSDLEVLRAMELAKEHGRPDNAVDYLVSPALAKYFSGVASTAFLFVLKDAVERKNGSGTSPAVPSAEELEVVRAASRAYEDVPILRGSIAATAAAVLLCLLAFKFGASALILAAFGALGAYVLGEDAGRKAVLRSAKHTRAVHIAQAAHTYAMRRVEYWKQLHWRDLELEVSRLFGRLGFISHATSRSGDKGVDVFAERLGEKVVIQCKQYSKPAQRNLVSELLGVMQAEAASRGVLICTGGFTKGAEDYAAANNVELWDLHELARRCEAAEKASESRKKTGGARRFLYLPSQADNSRDR